MKRYLVWALKIAGGLAVLVVILLVAAAALLNTSRMQQKLLGYATGLLQEKLETKVSIDSVSVDFLTFDISLIGLDVEDRQRRKMLQADRLAVNIDLPALLSNNVKISSAEIDGIRARLYQPKDSAANFQFVIDAFKPDPSKKKKVEEPAEEGKKKKLSVDVSSLRLSNIDLVYNEDSLTLGELSYKKDWRGRHSGQLRQLRGSIDRVTKKGDSLTTSLRLAELSLNDLGKQQSVTVDGLHVSLDNHKPRKNTGKPNRGFFDVGHLDVKARMELMVDHIGTDSAHFALTKFEARDSVTGFNVRDLRLVAGVNKEAAHVRDITLQQESTVLTFDSATVCLPSKKAGRDFSFHTSTISGKTLLKDISRPFAPVLHKFTEPLELKVRFSGNDSMLVFRDIHVNTPDQRLKIDADGGVDNLARSEDLLVHFHVKSMTTDSRKAISIINQFVVKKFMMKQLNNLGSIGFTGDVLIPYRKEQFRGQLRTSVGNVSFNLTLDENTKYLNGAFNTSSIHIGRLFEMEDIGPAACQASFTFDYSKPRTAAMRRKKGGKLPIGKVSATVQEASYKKVKVKNIKTTITSDGAVAQGNLVQKNKKIDILCDFTFTSTDSIHKMKFKPNLKLHNMPWQKQDKSQQKKQDKSQQKQEKSQKKKWWPWSKKKTD